MSCQKRIELEITCFTANEDGTVTIKSSELHELISKQLTSFANSKARLEPVDPTDPVDPVEPPTAIAMAKSGSIAKSRFKDPTDRPPPPPPPLIGIIITF